MKYVPSSDIQAHQNENSRHTRFPWPMEDGTFAYLDTKYNISDKKNVLDIGCDNGALIKHLYKADKKIFGLDLYNYLDEDIKDKTTFFSVDLNFSKIPIEDNSLDIVFAFQVVEHLENPFYVMREASRILKPGGLFILSIPNAFTLTSKLRFLLSGNVTRWGKHNDHLLFITPDVFGKTYGAEFSTLEIVHQKGVVPLVGRLLGLLGIPFNKHKLKVLPRVELFAKSTCYVLKKKES